MIDIRSGTAGPLVALALGALIGVLAPDRLEAQQFATDDATIVGFRACQLEAWHGETETRLEPACQPVRNLEIMIGAGLDVDEGIGVEEFTLELKTVVRELEPGGVGLALMAALDVAGPTADADAGRATGAFAVVPVSWSIGEDRVLLHGNLGWQWERDGDGDAGGGDRHALLWSLRGDLEVPGLDERFVLVGETFGTNDARPEYQLGLRTSVVRDRLLLDVSWGGHTAGGQQGRGWVVGLGWTPPPIR